jgi:hypothetical protein
MRTLEKQQAIRHVLAWSLVGALGMASGAADGTAPVYVRNRAGERPKPAVAVDAVCAWPNLTTLPDGTILATIHNQPSHLQQPADVDCWASADGGVTWTKRGTPAPRDDQHAARGMVAAGLARNGDLIVITTGHADTIASRPGHGPITPPGSAARRTVAEPGPSTRRDFPKALRGRCSTPMATL